MISDYNNLNIINATHKLSIYNPEEHICLYGETILDLNTMGAIQIVGDTGVGKTTIVNRILLNEESLKKLFTDRATYNFREKLFVNYVKGECYPLKRCIYLIKEDKKFIHKGLEETLSFIVDELNIDPEVIQLEEDLDSNINKVHQMIMNAL